MSPSDEIDSLWAIANARRDAGEPTRRNATLGYSPSPGDGEITARLWLDEAEADRLHRLMISLPSAGQLAYEARQRIIVKIVKRKLLQISSCNV